MPNMLNDPNALGAIQGLQSNAPNNPSTQTWAMQQQRRAELRERVAKGKTAYPSDYGVTRTGYPYEIENPELQSLKGALGMLDQDIAESPITQQGTEVDAYMAKQQMAQEHGFDRGIDHNPVMDMNQSAMRAAANKDSMPLQTAQATQAGNLATEQQKGRDALALEEAKHKASQTGIDAAADAYVKNPDFNMFKTMPAQDRGDMIQSLAQRHIPVPNEQQTAVKSLMTQAKDTIHMLKTTPGREGAIGMPAINDPGSWQRLLGMEPREGSDAAGYMSYVNQLKSLLTMPELKNLRGLGHMSDREFAAIQNLPTALSSKMNEQVYARELARAERRIDKALQRYQNGVVLTDEQLHTLDAGDEDPLADEATGMGKYSTDNPAKPGQRYRTR